MSLLKMIPKKNFIKKNFLKKNFNKKYKNFEQYFQAVTLDVFAQVKSSSAFEALVVNSDNLIRGTLKNSF